MAEVYQFKVEVPAADKNAESPAHFASPVVVGAASPAPRLVSNTVSETIHPEVGSVTETVYV